MWDLSFLARDGTLAPCIGSVESQPLDRRGGPSQAVVCVCVSMFYSHRNPPQKVNTLEISKRC